MSQTAYRQAELRHETTHLVTWVDTSKAFQEGHKVRLKGDDRWWTVEKLYGISVYKKDIHNTWNAGGL